MSSRALSRSSRAESHGRSRRYLRPIWTVRGCVASASFSPPCTGVTFAFCFFFFFLFFLFLGHLVGGSGGGGLLLRAGVGGAGLYKALSRRARLLSSILRRAMLTATL
jgi:hypothetical protein